MGCSTVNNIETPFDELKREVSDLRQGAFYHTDTITSLLTKIDIITGKMVELTAKSLQQDTRINVLEKRFLHHINSTTAHYEGQAIEK